MVRNKTTSDKLFAPINVIGVNASGVLGLSKELKKLILSAKRLSAPSRILSTIITWWTKHNPDTPLPELFESEKTIELIKWLKGSNEPTVLLASGDPLWFGIGRVLVDNLPPEKLIFHPSPTCLQLAFARLGKPWQDVSFISLHGRDSYPLLNILQKKPQSICVLTDPNKGGAKEVKELLIESTNEKMYTLWIFERLGHKEERIHKISPEEELPILDPLHLVVLIKNDDNNLVNIKNIPLFGIEDSIYSQYEDRPGLMTKREIRIQVLADLELPKDGVLWDVGAGVGSIGLEALRIRPNIKLIAIEKRLGSKALILANARKLSVTPTKVIQEDALKLLENGGIPKRYACPNRVILGGGGKNKINILEKILNRLNSGVIIVIPIATLENLEQITLLLKKIGCSIKISQHQNYRGVPLAKGTRLSPMNPIFIIKAKLK